MLDIDIAGEVPLSTMVKDYWEPGPGWLSESPSAWKLWVMVLCVCCFMWCGGFGGRHPPHAPRRSRCLFRKGTRLGQS